MQGSLIIRDVRIALWHRIDNRGLRVSRWPVRSLPWVMADKPTQIWTSLHGMRAALRTPGPEHFVVEALSMPSVSALPTKRVPMRAMHGLLALRGWASWLTVVAS